MGYIGYFWMGNIRYYRNIGHFWYYRNFWYFRNKRNIR